MQYALDAKSYPLYVVKVYKNDHVLDLNEFNADVKIFKNVKSNLNRRFNNKNIDLRLIVNQIITLRNVFEPIAVARILFYITDPHLHPMVLSLISFLGLHDTSRIPEVNDAVKKDENIFKELLELV